MKKKLIAFLVLIIAVCSLFTACVKTRATDALKYDGSVAASEITETVGNSIANYDFYDRFSVEGGFSVEVKKNGIAQTNLSAIELEEGLNTFNIVVSGNNDSANFVLKIKRKAMYTVTIKKVVDGEIVEGADKTETVEEGSGVYNVPDSLKPTSDSAKETWVGYKLGQSTASQGYIPTALTSSKTLYAHFRTKEFEVSFDGEEQVLKYGAPIVAPTTNSTPADTAEWDYEFLGWVVDANGNGTADDNETAIVDFTNLTTTKNVAYVTKYSQTKKTYLVSFDGAGSQLEYGASIVPPTPADKDDNEWDYTFVGWKVEGTADTAIVDLTNAKVSGAVAYVSVYTREAKGFVVNLPTSQTGYTLTANKDLYQVGDTVRLEFTLDQHYNQDTSAIVVIVNETEYTYQDIATANGIIELDNVTEDVTVTVAGLKANVYTLTTANGTGYTVTGTLSGNALSKVTLTINYELHYGANVDDVVVTVGGQTYSYADGTIDYGTNEFEVQLVENAQVIVAGVQANEYVYEVKYIKENVGGGYGSATPAQDLVDTFELTEEDVEDIINTLNLGAGFEFLSYEVDDDVITIKFNRARYTISFEDGAGNAIGTTYTNVRYETLINVPTAPAVVNPDPEKIYTFAGWKIKGEDDSTATVFTKAVASGVFVPVYTAIDKTYTVSLPQIQEGYSATIDVAEGKKGDDYTITVVIDENYSKSINALDVFFNGVSNKEGWNFVAETLTATYNGKFSEDVEVTIEGFTENVYAISYVTDAAYTVSGTLSGKKGDAFEVVVTLSDGYRDSFENVNVTCGGIVAVKNASEYTFTISGEFALNGDMSLEISGYVQDDGYITIEYQVEDIAGGTYSVDNANSYTDRFDVFGNDEINQAKAKLIEGFTFAEVITDALIEEEGAYVGGKLVVKYTRNTYSITIYDENKGAIVDTVDYKYGATIDLADATKVDDGENYFVFSGWVNMDGEPVELSTMGAQNIEIAPTFEQRVREYELVLNANVSEDIALIWYEPESATYKVGDSITFTAYILDVNYDRALPVLSINGNEYAFVQIPDSTEFTCTAVITKEMTVDGKIIVDVLGIEENTYLVQLPQTQEGYTATVYADSYTFGSEFKVLVSLQSAYDESTPVVTINGVPAQIVDGYYIGTINGDMEVVITGVEKNVYTIKGNGSIDVDGYEITDITVLGEEGAVQDAQFTFKVNVSKAYNQSIEDMKVYVQGSAGGKRRVNADDDGVYTASVNGNTTVIVEGLVQNVYNLTANVEFVQDNATYKRINSLEDVEFYVNGEKQSQVEVINLALEVGVTYSIEYKNKKNGEVIYSNEVKVEEGDEDIDLGTIYLGRYNLAGYTTTADAHEVTDLGTSVNGMIDTTFEGDFLVEYTMIVDKNNSTETDPVYGFVLAGGEGVNAVTLSIGLIETGVRIYCSGADRVSSMEQSSIQGTPIRLLVAEEGGATLKLVRSKDVVYFYLNDKVLFALDTVNGFVGINNNTVGATSAENANIKDRLYSIFSLGNIRIGAWSTVAQGKTLDRTIIDVSAADSISHAINNSALTTYGEIFTSDDYDPSNDKKGGKYEFLLPGTTTYVGADDANGNDGVLSDTVYHLDLSAYKGALQGQNVKVKISPASDVENVNTISLQERAVGSTEWSDVKDITNACDRTGDDYYYTIKYEVGKEYRFYTTFRNASVKTTVAFNVQDDTGANLEGLTFKVYQKNADGTAGALVDSGFTTNNTIPGQGDFLGVVHLSEGEYIINIDGGGRAFGKNVEVTVSKSQVDNAELVEVETIVLEKNIWGNTTSGAQATFNTTSKEDYSVTFNGLDALSSYLLDQTLADDSMIKVTLKFNGEESGNRAHGLYDVVGDSFYDENGDDCDMYIKNTVDEMCFATLESPITASSIGIGSSGNVWGAGIETVKASPFGDIVDQFVVSNNFDISYDLAYARVVENGIPYIYLLAKYSTATDYTVMAKREAGKENGEYVTESVLKLQVTSRGGRFNQNFTYSNFDYVTGNVAKFIEESMEAEVSPGAVGYDPATDTYSAIISGNGKAYVSGVRGDKTQGVFTIEADIEASSYGGYAVRGFMMIDPKTGNMLHIGPRDVLYEGQMYASLSRDNGYAYRLELNYNANTTNEPIIWLTEGIDKNNLNNADRGYIKNNGYTLLEEGETVTFYLKAEVDGDYWKIYGGKTKENAVLLYEGNLKELFETKATKSGHVWEGDAENLYPNANVVAMGMYSFGDGKDVAKYSNVKVTYTSHVDLAKEQKIKEVISYAANKGISLNENSSELDVIKSATTMEELDIAVENAKARVDFYERRNDKANELTAWASNNSDFNSILTVQQSDRNIVLSAQDDEDLAVKIIEAQFAIAKRGAQADFNAWYASKAEEINGVITSGEKTQADFDNAKVEALAVISATTEYAQLLPSITSAQNVIIAVIDATLGGAKANAIATINAVGASYNLTAYGLNELNDAKTVAINALNAYATKEEIELNLNSLVETVTAVANKVNTTFATVTFINNGATYTTLSSIKYGTEITVADPAKASSATTDYTFAGWSDGSNVVEVVTTETLTALYDESARVYSITATSGTGYNVSVAQEAENGSTVTMVITLGSKYNRCEPTVKVGSATAQLVSKDGNALTYSFVMPTENATVVVSGVTENTYSAEFNLYVINNQNIPLIATNAQVDVYIDDELVQSATASGKIEIKNVTAEQTHNYAFKVGEDVWVEGSFTIKDGAENFSRDVFVGQAKGENAGWKQKEDGLHNDTSKETNKIVNLDGTIKKFDNVAFEYTVKTTAITETDPGYGFKIFDENSTKGVGVVFMRTGLRIFPATQPTSADRITLESVKMRDENIKDVAQTTGVTLKIVRIDNVIYFFYNDILQFQFDTTNGLKGYTFTEVDSNNGTDNINDYDQLARDLTAILSGKIQIALYNTAGFTNGAVLKNVYTNIGYSEDSAVITNAYMATVTAGDANITFRNDIYSSMSSGNVISGHALEVVVTNPARKMINTLSLNGEEVEIIKTANGATYTFTPEKGKTYAFTATYEDVQTTATANISIADSANGTYYVGATYTLTNSASEMVYSGTIDSANLSLPIAKAGTYTLNIAWSTYTVEKQITFEVSQSQIDDSAIINKNVTLDYVMWGNSVTASEYTRRYDATNGYSLTVNFLGNASSASANYALAPKLANGKMIKYSVKFGSSMGYNKGKTANEILAHDPYMKNKVGGVEIGLSSKSTAYIARNNPNGVVKVKGAPFASYADELYANNYDLVYDFAYAQVDGVVYFLAKLSTQTTYHVISKVNASASENVVELILSGAAAERWHEYTYSNFEYVTDTNAINNLIALGQADTIPNYNRVGVISTSEADGEYSWIANGAVGAYLPTVIGDKTTGTFEISADVAVNTMSTYPAIGLTIADPVSGNFVNFVFDRETKRTSISVDTGNGSAYRIEKTQIEGRDANCEELILRTGLTFNFKAIVSGDMVELFVNGRSAGYLNLYDTFYNGTTRGGYTWNTGVSERYPTANNIALGLYSWSDNTCIVRYTNIKVNYITNDTYLADAKASAKGKVDEFVASEINGVIDGYTYSSTSYANLNAVTYSANEILKNKIATAITADKNANMESALSVFKAKALVDIENEVGQEFVSDEMTTLINNSTTVKELANNYNAAIALAQAYMLSGIVTNGDGEAISGATVAVSVDGTVFSGITSADGSYKVKVGFGEKTTVTVSADGYVIKENIVYNASDAENQTQNFALNQILLVGRTAQDKEVLFVTENSTEATTADSKTVEYTVYNAEYKMNEEYNVETYLADGASFAFTLRFNGASNGRLAHQTAFDGTGSINNNSTVYTNDSAYLKNSIGGVRATLNAKGCFEAGTNFVTTGKNPFDFAFDMDFVKGNFYSGIGYDFMYVRQGNTVKVYAKFNGTDYWVHGGTVTLTSSDPAKIIFYLTGNQMGWVHNYTYSNLEYKANGATENFLVMDDYGADVIEKPYAGYGKYVREQGDQYDKYLLKVGTSNQAPASNGQYNRSDIVLKDASFDLTAQNLTIQSDVTAMLATKADQTSGSAWASLGFILSNTRVNESNKTVLANNIRIMVRETASGGEFLITTSLNNNGWGYRFYTVRQETYPDAVTVCNRALISDFKSGKQWNHTLRLETDITGAKTDSNAKHIIRLYVDNQLALEVDTLALYKKYNTNEGKTNTWDNNTQNQYPDFTNVYTGVWLSVESADTTDSAYFANFTRTTVAK